MIKKATLDVKNYESMANTMETKIDNLKQQINHWEGEIKTLKARHKVAITSQKINKQMISMSDNNAQALLENMKEKVNKEEINAAIGTQYSNDVQQQLLELKKQVAPQYLLEQKDIQEQQ